MEPISSASLVDALRWRYATKQFDPERAIPDEIWSDIEKALVLTPSSYGLQPWKFFVITDQGTKDALLPHAWNQRQVVDCSHLVVMATPTDFQIADIERFVARTAEVRGISIENLVGFRDMMVSALIDGMPDRLGEWAMRQAYIALGNLMTTAALLKVDACPMEGFVSAGVDEVLGLEDRGFTTAVMCPLGYRAPEDRYAALPKVRFKLDDVIEWI